MEYIDDLSWSNIVNLIQHEEIKGADLLNGILYGVVVRHELCTIQSVVHWHGFEN